MVIEWRGSLRKLSGKCSGGGKQLPCVVVIYHCLGTCSGDFVGEIPKSSEFLKIAEK